VLVQVRGVVHQTTTLPGAIWLGVAHFVVDGACVSAVLRASPPGDSAVASALAFVLAYDLLAFAGQVPFGWLIDRFALRRGAAVTGLVLSALALVAGGAAGSRVVLLAGAGNALFHVGAGAMVLAGSRGRAAPAGIFVAPGALGLGLGILLGRKALLAPLWPFYFAIAAACAAVLLVAKRTALAGDEAQPAALRRGEIVAILALLSFSVAVRSLVGTVACDGCSRSFFLLLVLPLVAFTGKLTGGLLADRFGWIDLAMVALLASAPLLAFADGDLWLALPGLLIFQMTMPVTLAAALRALPAWPGFGFGVLCFALVAGTLPAYLPGGWRPHGTPLLLLVLASAAALYLALRLLLARPQPRTIATAPPTLDSSPSTLCRGLP
jgi:FSR family fosmidomycin resistance protein-like MFS transporter